MNTTNETFEFEDRRYVQPQRTLDEQNSFIDKLRAMESSDLAKIERDTHALGTDVPSIHGGLTGSGNIWRERFEKPQTNSLVSGLKSTAQASALETALNNLRNQWKKRYDKALSDSENSGNSNGAFDTKEGDPYEEVIGSGLGITGSYFVYDKNGNLYTTMNVGTDDKGNITGIDTQMQSYDTDAALNIIDNLKNNGYTFKNANGQVVEITSGR